MLMHISPQEVYRRENLAVPAVFLQYHDPTVLPPGAVPVPGGNLSTLNITRLGEWQLASLVSFWWCV
jgi:hypothetical protein